ncbi:MAG: sigma-70 family RNA polymerase sigma factor [Clostridia bacterium]|nr:sigma-70 family RNA polymerase sigma factor [Clostridia bacterium]
MNEEQLIQRATEGDAEAFNALLGAHEQQMYALCLRMCCNPEDAQDCLQEAMLRVFRAISTFKGQSAFSTWLYRIAMNTSYDLLRKRKNAANVSADQLFEEGWSPVDANETPEQRALHSEQRVALNDMIQSLPEDMRAAVVLRDVQGFSYEEISQIMNVNVGTVKSRISRGRERLRKKIIAKPELFNR